MVKVGAVWNITMATYICIPSHTMTVSALIVPLEKSWLGHLWMGHLWLKWVGHDSYGLNGWGIYGKSELLFLGGTFINTGLSKTATYIRVSSRKLPKGGLVPSRLLPFRLLKNQIVSFRLLSQK